MVWKDVSMVLTLWTRHLIMLAGVLYTAGLIPWSTEKLEFHNAIWHACVLVASGCIFVAMYCEVSQPRNWKVVESGQCQGQLLQATVAAADAAAAASAAAAAAA